MSIDIVGGMIVGACVKSVSDSLNWDEDFDHNKWAEELGMTIFSESFDCDFDEKVMGFPVRDIDPLSQEFHKWQLDVKVNAENFFELTGVKAKLIGMQDVY